MVTKAEILQSAKDLELGEVEELAKLFRSWQRFGLVGKMAAKASRRGGEGLWHPAQQALFIAALVNWRGGTHLTTAANLPVGLWCLGTEGVELRQAQRALFYWATRRALGGRFDPGRGKRPTGRYSMRELVIVTFVERIAHPDASATAKRALRDEIRNQTDGLAATSVRPPVSFTEKYLAVASADRRSTTEDRENAAATYFWLRFQVRAAPYIPAVCADRREVRDFWMWIRRYMFDQLKIRSRPPKPPWWAKTIEALTAQGVFGSELIQRSCSEVIVTVGAGFRILAGGEWPSDLLRPPLPPGVELDPSWAEPDNFIEVVDAGRRRLDALEAAIRQAHQTAETGGHTYMDDVS